MRKKKPANPKNATRPDLLGRIAMLELSERDVAEAAGLPQGFISKMRAGRNGDERALPSVEKLERWLDGKAAEPEPAPVTKAPDKPALTPEARKILAGIEDSDTFEKLNCVSKLILAGIFLEEIDRALGRLLFDAIKERRQVLERAIAEKAAGSKTEPVTVRVVFTDALGAPYDWRNEGANRG